MRRVMRSGEVVALARHAAQHAVDEAALRLPSHQGDCLIHRGVVGRAQVQQLVGAHAQRDERVGLGAVERGELAELDWESALEPADVPQVQLRDLVCCFVAPVSLGESGSNLRTGTL